MKVYDDLNDGSTTDGSISMIGEGEHNHRQEDGITEGHGFETDELSKSPSTTTTATSPSPPPAAASTSTSTSALPLQMWMRCTPIDMSIQYSKRPLPPRPYEPHRCQRPTSVAELSLAEHNIASDLLNYLDRLNNFMSRIYLLQVFLLFLSAGSIALLAIIYSRYSACKLEIKDLEQKLYSTKADKYQIEGNLARCEYLYEMEMEKTATAPVTVNSDFKPATDDGDVTVTIDATVVPTQTGEPNFIVKPEIQPTRRLASIDENMMLADGEKLQTVWTGADDSLIATKKPRNNAKEKHFAEIECADTDDGSLFSEYNREYCENQKKNQPTKVYATHYSYEAIDDGECNPNKIDFTLGIDHARKILRETNCDDDGTLKYLEKAYENFEANTKNEQSGKRHKQHTKRVDKTNAKWEKAQQKINSSVIKIDKYNDGSDVDDVNSAEDRFERKEKRNRRGDKKSKRNVADNDDDDKENNRRRKNDRKDATATMSKKSNPDKDKDIGVKRIKNDRKRDMVKVYEHRPDYHHDD